jgi:hypothetical protein
MNKSNIGPTKILKKRGRKPKNKLPEINNIIEENVDTENEVIIAYLPIKTHDLEINNDDKDIDKLFIKSENDIICNTEDNLKEKVELINSSIESDIKINNKYLNKINIYNIEFQPETKCWWCKNIFNTPKVSLPEQFNNDTFYCIGNFCSYNCAKAYNIDLNDNQLWKRESLLNLLYYSTYGYYKEIIAAPSWLLLKEFGGFMDIKEFRKSFETNNTDYLVLHPPLISRQMQIEESYKKFQPTQTNTSKIDKFLFDSNNLMLKRNKPVETSQLNLETTMGLKRKTIKI